MLDKFEKHMVEIQSNVKVLTMERDKFRGLYEQVNVINRDYCEFDLLNFIISC